MLVVFGMHHFRKNVGHYFQVETCRHCGCTYQKNYIKESKWVHVYFIPMIPAGSNWYKECPICNAAEQVKRKQAKMEMQAFPPVAQELQPRVNVHTATGKYDMLLEDRRSGRVYQLGMNTDKKRIRQINKARLYKNVPEICV